MKDLISRELGITGQFSLIEERSGVDLVFAHPDEQISAEKRKLLVRYMITSHFSVPQTYYVFNDSLSSEYEVKKLIQDNQERQAGSETQVDLCKYLPLNLNLLSFSCNGGLD